MSSMSSASVQPAPGPATVRLALIRTGLEIVGLEIVRDEIFPLLRTIPLWVRPPERVAISKQLQRVYKVEQRQSKRGILYQESMTVREMAHASGFMTIYAEIPAHQEAWYRLIFRAIGYWGQAESLTTCVSITHQKPPSGECAMPLAAVGCHRPLQPFLSSIVSEFRDHHITWEEIITPDRTSPLRLDVYVWPLVVVRQSGAGKLLVRRALVL